MLTPAELTQARAIAQLTYTSRVSVLGEVTGAGWDPDTGPSEGTAEVLWTGQARVLPAARQAGNLDAAGQPLDVLAYRVSLPNDAPVLDAHRVEILEDLGDDQATGRMLQVASVAVAGLGVERVIECSWARHQDGVTP